ncbi:MAG: acyl-CoA dehydrogenase family protein, partial [Sphingomonas sp.]
TASSVTDRALQLHGGYGYLKDYPIERFWRDLRVNSILEGTNQVMRMIVGRELTRQ